MWMGFGAGVAVLLGPLERGLLGLARRQMEPTWADEHFWEGVDLLREGMNDGCDLHLPEKLLVGRFELEKAEALAGPTSPILLELARSYDYEGCMAGGISERACALIARSLCTEAVRNAKNAKDLGDAELHLALEDVVVGDLPSALKEAKQAKAEGPSDDPSELCSAIAVKLGLPGDRRGKDLDQITSHMLGEIKG
jgi:hypothetical protein